MKAGYFVQTILRFNPYMIDSYGIYLLKPSICHLSAYCIWPELSKFAPTYEYKSFYYYRYCRIFFISL
jgi:hypothetical protein